MRASRDLAVSFVLQDPEECLGQIMDLLASEDLELRVKSSWIIELVTLQNIRLILPYQDRVLSHINQTEHASYKRCMGHVALRMIEQHFKKSSFVVLTPLQIQHLIHTFFDWLLESDQIACRSYAIHALYHLGKLETWIYPELKAILQKNYPQEAKAYQAAARKVLSKIS